jgi:hypothetical protein
MIVREADVTRPAQDGFGAAASEEVIQAVARRLRARNMEAVVVDNAEEARRAVLERLPEHAEVHSGKSKTLEDIGVIRELQQPDRYDWLRARYLKMDRKTQAREIRKLIAGPDYMLGSVQAVTEGGVLVAVSATGNQLAPYASSAGKLILVVGSQKIVPDLDAALRRIQEYALPWEDARLREARGIGSFLGKILLIEREWVAGRTTVILVREPAGV